MKINRNLLMQALKVAKSTATQFPANRSLKDLSERGLGQIVGNQYRIDRTTRIALRDWLRNEGVDWTAPESAFRGDRLDVALSATNEKIAPAPPPSTRLLITAMGRGVRLNGKDLPVLDGAFVSIPIAMIQQVDARFLLLVENKPAFESLFKVAGDYDRDRVLAVYRGDPQTPYGQRWARKASQSHSIPLAAYMDFDPAGLSMGISSGASRLLLPIPDELSALKGSAHDFRNQHIDWERLRKGGGKTDVITPWIEYLGSRKAGFTQERLIAHQINHAWKVLTEEPSDGC
tara:strand:+ start:6362 stop:7228 length:867 start_codon:yes stop_codon:yes gene_type:complete